MDMYYLVGVLMLGTLSAGAIFGVVSAHKTQKRLENPNTRKSTLAADAPSHRADPPDV